VYGANTTLPFSVHQNVDHPLSLYAATIDVFNHGKHTRGFTFQSPTPAFHAITVLDNKRLYRIYSISKWMNLTG